MFVSLVKIKKYLIYLFLFLFFNCLFIGSLKADPTHDNVVSISDEHQLPYGITFNDDGTKMYTVGFNFSGTAAFKGDRIVEYRLDPAYDISSKVVVHRLRQNGSTDATNTVTSDITTRPHDIRFNDDGTRMYLPMLNQSIKTFSLSTAYDLSTASLIHTLSAPSNSSTSQQSIEFNTNGTKVFIEDGDEIDEYNVATAFDLSSTLTYVDSLDFIFADHITSMAFSDDGTVLFLSTQQSNDGDDTNDANIYEYNLTTGFDLSTATYVEKFNVENEESRPEGIAFNSDGDKVFIIGTLDDVVSTYTLSPKYNLGNPTLTSSVPADNATGVSVDANIVLNFSESVNVNSGEITIHKSADDVKVATIDVTSSNVTGTGTSQITINPTDDLEYGIEYYVLLPASAFVDSNSNPGYSAAISSGALSFTVNSDRIDPTTIKDVIGSIDAQSELAKHYISQSIDTVSNRLRYLRQNKLSNTLSKHDLPIHIDIGDTVQITNSRLGFTDKTFELTGWQFSMNQGNEAPIPVIDANMVKSLMYLLVWVANSSSCPALNNLACPVVANRSKNPDADSFISWKFKPKLNS